MGKNLKFKRLFLTKALALAVMAIGIAGCDSDDNVSSPATKVKSNKLYITQTDKAIHFEKSDDKLHQQDSSTLIDDTLVLNPLIRYQSIDGFGYTLTGGSATHLSKMSQSTRYNLLRELFGTGEKEIGVSYLRVSVGASDLDPIAVSLNDMPDGQLDPSLKYFSLANEEKYVIPILKEILGIAPNLKIMATPWSPPSWMKSNKNTKGGSLLPEFYDTYAEYLIKYIEGMAKHGITIDALTIQNEPLHPGNNPSMLMLADEQAIFIKNHLGPKFKAAGIKTKIVIYDHNADRPDYPISILNDEDAAQYIDGSAFHLYGGDVSALSEVHDAAPDKNVYFTEQWVGGHESIADAFPWHIENITIGALNNWSKTALEWNLSSNPELTPFTPGGCDACLGAVTIDGDEVTRNAAYYSIAHASKFIRPHSVRIDSNQIQGVNSVAFITPENDYVIILQNRSGQGKNINIKINGLQEEQVISLDADAVATVVIDE